MNNIKSNIKKDDYCIRWCWLDYKLMRSMLYINLVRR